jgi:signal transduction histidine kinase
VDDEEILLTVLADIFSEYYDLQMAISGEAALKLLQEGFLPEVIIADQRMGGMSGAQFLAKSMEFVPETVRVILTGYTDVQDIIDSINLGNVYRFLTKPWQREELIEAVRLCFEHYDLRTRNTELTASLQKVRELNNEKDEVLGIVAHDLKNPLQVIREYSEMCMEDEEMDAGMRQTMLRSVVKTANRMFDIIKNLLDINALERGAITLTPMNFSLESIVSFVVGDYRARAEAKNITLHVEEIKGLKVFADETMTIQVLDNLISNAVKYSPPGKNIFVRIKDSHSSDNNNPRPMTNDQVTDDKITNGKVTNDQYVRVEIADEGPGISPEDMQKLFGKFARLTAQPTGNEHSTGLGLSIVKKIVEAMNGKVWCESELGKGATFIVELPAAQALGMASK